MFIQGGGFEYILSVFMSKQLSSSSSMDCGEGETKSAAALFDLKHMAFLLKILRIFIMAAFSTSPEESSVYDAATLVRRSSSSTGAEGLIETKTSVQTTESDQPAEGSRFR